MNDTGLGLGCPVGHPVPMNCIFHESHMHHMPFSSKWRPLAFLLLGLGQGSQSISSADAAQMLCDILQILLHHTNTLHL